LCQFPAVSNIRAFLEKHVKVEEFCIKNMIVECKYICTKFQETLVTHLTGNHVLLSKQCSDMVFNHFNLVHRITTCFYKIHFNIIHLVVLILVLVILAKKKNLYLCLV
jgi:hypothetical protein